MIVVQPAPQNVTFPELKSAQYKQIEGDRHGCR